MKSNYSGIKVNIEALAAGVYNMILDHPNGECMTLGMFPADIMESLERNLKDKVPDNYRLKDDSDPLNYIDGKRVRREIVHAITCEVLRLATESGLCIA